MARAKAIDWRARHTPASGTVNASLTALSVAAVGSQTDMPASWALGASAIGALGSAIAGTHAEQPLAKGSIILRTGAWLAAGGWTSYALNQSDIWDWGVIGPLVGLAFGFGSAAGAMASKHRKDQARREEARNALFRVKLAREWTARIERVCGVKGCVILNIEPWKNKQGDETGAGYDLEVRLPEGGSTWRTLQAYNDGFAGDLDLPEGCGVSVTHGATRGTAIIRVQTFNALLETLAVPHDASELSFEEDFDLGVERDAGLALVNIREFSAMLVGAKRTGKTNQLLTIITRLLRMPNLRVWVIDFNGGGVALQWVRAWDALGRPGRSPIDWVAATPDEAEQMALAAVRIAKARKLEYQQLMAEHNTDLLPMTADLPGIVIVTDEGAEVYADLKMIRVSNPMREVLRIAGASGVNQINCFLRSTSSTTGDTLIKSQSRVMIGMRMGDDEEIGQLFGWRAGVKPEDMPERGYGAYSMNPSGPASIFRGYRTLPSDIAWFVEHTAQYRQNESLDEVSLRAAGEVYATRWADDRAGFIFTGAPMPVSTGGGGSDDQDSTPASWKNRPLLTPEEASAKLREDIEAANAEKAERMVDPFDQVLADAGIDPGADPSTWPEHVRASALEPEEDSAEESMRDVVFGLVKAMTPKGGIQVQDIIDSIKQIYGDDAAPTRQTITRWLRVDDRIYKPTGYGKYAVREEYM